MDEVKKMSPQNDQDMDQIAVVGMAGRFPRAETLDAFWSNLCDGVESISLLSEEELRAAGVHPAFLADPAYVRAQSMLEGFDQFDAGFFGFSPREAEITNPQHRLFLECCWQALEDAGIDPASFDGTVGVFASCSSNTYILDLFAQPELIRNLGGLRVQIANEKEFLPTWVSYKLDLRGPSVNVQTACSSSLVAVHMACQSLLNGECDVALVGGVSVRSLERRGYFYQEGNILSPDGHCRAFDAASNGTVDGDGAGVVVLKRMADAREDGDNLQAVILGSAINNDGALKVGFTAPSEEGQTRVISEALSIAGIEADTLGYVEAHGTGTRLGDPIEVAALSAALRARTKKRGFCALGSVKTNLGHLDAGAGIAGLIKTVLSLKHGVLPPSLHFREPNPEIDFADSPIYVNGALAPWKTEGKPRRAGVSSFGIGGTNAHAILQQAPDVPSGPSREWQLVVWSAKTEGALDTATENLSQAFGSESAPGLADAAFTLAIGRRPFEHRRALVCRQAGDFAEAAGDARRILSGNGPATQRPVAFLFPGQGAQQAGATHEVYQNEKVFRTEVDRCAELLRPHLGADLREVLYPADGDQEIRLEDTAWAQPAMFVVDYALARLWMSWGIRPQALIGHSLGEYVAACLAGVLALEEALPLVALRGKLMQELPAGAMLAAPVSEAEVTPLLTADLALAAINAPQRTVVSGPLPAIEDLEKKLAEQGLEGRRLRTSHAFHSAMMEPMLAAFTERLRTVRFKAPQIPYVSNVTGDWITEAQATDPGFWLRQLREPVRFGDGIGRLLEQRSWALLEVGPGRTLTSLVQQHPAFQGNGRSEHRAIGSLVRPSHTNSEMAALLEALGRLWASGVEIDWKGFYRGERRRRVSLPTYPFERQKYLIDRTAGAAAPWTELAVRQRELSQDLEDGSMNTGVRHALVGMLKNIIHDLTGTDMERIDPQVPFMDIGVDSLLMVQAARRVRDEVGVQLSVVQFLEELTTLEKVAEYVEREMSHEKLAALVPAAVAPPPGDPHPRPLSRERERGAGYPSPVQEAPLTHTPLPLAGEGPGVRDLLAQQLQVMSQVMSQQLQLLQGGVLAPAPAAPPPAPAAPTTWTQFANFHPINKQAEELTPQQRAYLDQFIRRYTARTAKSKELTERYRRPLADGRTTIAFRRMWKEIVYPIHSERSKGAHIWDVDGNDYVDISMGFGLHYFGHSPDFLMEALERQMRQGLELGPQSPLAGQVAELLCSMTGMDRALVCTSGTEAILGALRVARTVTGRNKVAVLSDSFHGWSDTTMVRRPGGRLGAVPGAPGISPGTLEEVIVLEYGSPEAIQQLESLGGELAAVLVEPVRSRFPDQQPREFLQALRRVTTQTGALLIFDEIVTGFRIHPGGAQAWFGVQADLATYGKMVAGGLPIGVLAGRAAVMDALDGGAWRFGDDSYPQVEKTLFTGTYFKHPLTLAAAYAVLDHLRQAGPGLQEGLNARTAQLAADLNAWFQASNVPMEAVHFGPLFRFRPGRQMRYPELFYFHLVDHGVYFTQESGNCFLTTAHSEEDILRIRQAVQRSVQDLVDGGFLPEARPVPVPSPLPVQREVEERSGRRDSSLLEILVSKSISSEPEAPLAPGTLELPVTDGQRVLWIASKISPMANRSYNEPLALHLRGALGVPEIRAAVQHVSDRHQALRCSFTPDGTRQKIPLTRPVPVPLIDYSALPEPHRSREVRWCLKTLAGGLFNLEHGPLLRAGLLRVDAEEHYLSLTAHHIVIDGGSAGVMVRELTQLYTALRNGQPNPLPPAGSLADYVRRVLARSPDAPDQKAAEAYWTQLFERPVSLLQLPLDRPRPRTIPWWGERLQQVLDVDLVSGIRRVSAQLKATPYATILAAWGAVLHEITRHDDLIVGVPSRDPDVTGPMVGYFINLLPVRMPREPEETFRSHLSKVRQSVFDVMEHQNYPLNRLLERIGLAGGLDGFIIGTTFNMERIEAPRPMPGLDAEYAWVYHDAARIDLHVNLMEDTRTGAGLLDFAYKTTTYDRTSVERWASAFRSVLREIVDNPDVSLRALPLLTAGERQQLLVEWNDTRVEDAEDLCLHELFEQQAARRPGAPALALRDAELSYAELDRLSTRLAVLLTAQGVGPEVRVGLSLDRSFEVIVALLAILKAGGAYVFLDPNQPRERLLFLLRDSEIPLLITHGRVIEKLGEGLDEIGTRVLDGDAGWPARPETGVPALLSHAGAGPDNLAYVLYTSGSTGTPNGVMVAHRSAVNVVRHARELCQAGPDSRLSLTTFLGFDVSVHEIFLALAHGGCLCIIPDNERTNPYLLAERVARYQLTTACFTPSMLAVLPEAQLASVTSLAVAGEAFSADLAEKWSRGRRFLNFYGPTETTIFSTFEIFEDAVLGLKAPTIGRPVRNLEVYVVDSLLQPVPIGVIGEIVIGGVGVSRGYVNRPDKTAAKFIPNPFAEGEPGARLYLTGDTARLRADGRIEYLGRADGQVKLRGFRIELGEIESTIAAWPGVLEVAVAVRGEGTAQKLAAYVVWEEGRTSELAGLRDKVESRLPEYMVPSSWIELPALPRNANGKVDRLVLRAMQDAQSEREHVDPETPLERFLVDLWREILRVDKLSLHDNFLEMGGNSISGAMMAYHIQETLGEELHAVAIFDAPTVAKLARLLGERYPDRVLGIWGEESLPESVRKELMEMVALMDESEVEEAGVKA
jgi:amino acid adenylation domain-containing protein